MTSNFTISAKELSAIIFDLDGTIIDNMSFHYLAWQELLVEMGHDWSLARVQEEIWGKNEDIFERVFPGRYSSDQVAELSLRKELRYIERYRPHIKMIDGLPEFLEKARALEVKLAVATAAPKVCVDFVVDALRLDRFFSQVVHADQVIRSKPHPETFLTAAKLLAATPDRCLVFEDAPVGARAASAASMKSIILLTTHREEEFSSFENVIGFVKDYRSLEFC